jgi:anti-sigma factor RsiW
MSSCYTDDALRRLIDEDLDPQVFEAMELHIEACARCAAGLERIGRIDSGSGGAWRTCS